MKRLLALLAILTVIAGSAIAAAACGGDSDEEKAEKIIEDIIEEGGDGEGDGDVDIDVEGGELPKDFPEAFPIYENADVTFGMKTSTEEFGAGFTVTLETDDSPQDVVDFYEGALNEDPWSITSTMTEGDGASFFFEGEVDGTKHAGLVIVAVEDGKTTITISLGEDTSGQVPESKDLPADYPSDAPVYEGWVITDAGKSTSGGYTSFDITAVSEDDRATIGESFVSQLESGGWTVDSTDESSDSFTVNASKEDGSSAYIYISDSFQYEGYQEISVSVSLAAE